MEKWNSHHNSPLFSPRHPAQDVVKELLRPVASQPFRERMRCSGSKSHLPATCWRTCTCTRHPSLWLQESIRVLRVRVEDAPCPLGPMLPAMVEGSSGQQNCCGAAFTQSPLCATLCLRATLLISLSPQAPGEEMLSFPILQKRSTETLALSLQLQSLESRVLEPTLPMGPHKGVRGGSSKKSREQLVPPSTKIRLPSPYSCSGLTSPPSRHLRGKLGLETMLGPGGQLGEGGATGGVGGWEPEWGRGRSGGQNFTPWEEAPEGLSFPKRKSPFRARKEGEKTLSGV